MNISVSSLVRRLERELEVLTKEKSLQGSLIKDLQEQRDELRNKLFATEDKLKNIKISTCPHCRYSIPIISPSTV